MTNIAKQQSNPNQSISVALQPNFQIALGNIPSLERKLAELNLSSKKISSFDTKDYQKLYLYLVSLSKISGIKEPPDKDVLMTITGFLKENFSDFSQEEIDKAFNMAFAGKLPSLKPEDVTNYGVLTPVWFGKILNSYKELRSKELTKFHQEVNRLELEKQREVSEIEADNIMAIAVVEQYSEFIESGLVVDFGNSIYNWLTKKKFIELSDKQKINIFEEAKKILLNKSLDKSSTNPFDRVVNSLKDGLPENLAKSEAMTLAVKYYFKTLSENKTNIEWLFKKYLPKGFDLNKHLSVKK